MAYFVTVKTNILITLAWVGVANIVDSTSWYTIVGGPASLMTATASLSLRLALGLFTGTYTSRIMRITMTIVTVCKVASMLFLIMRCIFASIES